MAKKTYTKEQLIWEFTDSAVRASRISCPIVQHLNEMDAAGATVGDMVSWTMCHCGPELLAYMLADTVNHNDPESTAEVQEKCAWALSMQRWEKSRPHVELLLLNKLDVIADEPLIILIGLVVDQHPSAQGFLAQIEARVPDKVKAHFTDLEHIPWPT